MPEDDRKQFEAERREAAARMAADEALAADALALNVAADRHDWSYQWSWLGIPVIQLPPDIVALQEIIWETRPQLVIETGVARGGSLVLSASILELAGEGEVLGIDIDIRAHNREAIEAHPLARRIRMIEGSSVDDAVVDEARRAASAAERVMVILDSNHTHEHVLAELRAYAPLVTVGQFLVIADTFVEEIPPQEHRPRPWGPGDNPGTALRAWLDETDGFEPDPFVNAKLLVTASPGGYLRRVR
ncbi:MAG: cephalosporin hydroxylase family protein [Actinomycetota bacterium]|nr:cephalosporin hydroxylase family protein [Actinomycetota bacterium]